jgi:hypothetical protein
MDGVVVLLWLLLALAHVFVLAFVSLALVLRHLLAWRGRRRCLADLAAAAPAWLLVGAWLVTSSAALPGSVAGPAGGSVAAAVSSAPRAAAVPAAASVVANAPSPRRAAATSRSLEFHWRGATEKLGALGWSLIVASREGRVEWTLIACVAVLALVSLVRERRSGVAGSPGSGSRVRRWLGGVALLGMLLFVLLPSAIVDEQQATYGVFLIDQRFLVWLPLCGLPLLRWPPGRRVIGVLAATVVVLHLASAWSQGRVLGRAADAARGLDAAVAAIPPGKILKSLIYTPFPEGVRYQSLLHAGCYYQARRLGEVDHSFALLPFSPVRYRELGRPYLSRHDEHLAPEDFDWRAVLLYDYVLIDDRDGAWSRFYRQIPFERIVDQNGWIVMDIESARRAYERGRGGGR